MSDDSFWDDPEIQKIAAWHARCEFRKTAGQLEKDIWIAAARKFFQSSDRQPCFVCGKFFGITQAHHIIPLANQYDRGFEVPDNEHVWLCPNHHIIVHAFIPVDGRSLEPSAFRRRGKRSSSIHPDLSEAEFQKLMDLLQRSGRSPE